MTAYSDISLQRYKERDRPKTKSLDKSKLTENLRLINIQSTLDQRNINVSKHGGVENVTGHCLMALFSMNLASTNIIWQVGWKIRLRSFEAMEIHSDTNFLQAQSQCSTTFQIPCQARHYIKPTLQS